MPLLRFTIEGRDEPRADFADLAEFCDALVECLRRVHRVDHPGTSKLPRYKIQQAQLGSIYMALAGDACAEEAAVLTQKTIGDLRDRRQPRIPMTGDDVRAFRKLAGPLSSNTASIFVGEIPIDDQFREGCDWLLQKSPHSFGEAVGRIDGLNVHDRRFFRLYPEGQDRGAVCYFREEQYEEVHAALRRRVRVRGEIFRDPDGVGIDRILNIESIEILKESADLPSLNSLFGAFAANPVRREYIDSGWE